MTAAGLNIRGVPTDARFIASVSGRAAVPARASAFARHLVLAYRPGWQSIEDLNTIAAHVREFDPTIRTFIMPTTHRNTVSRKEAATRPTLVVSNGRMLAFTPLRGKVYQGWPIPKVEEVRRLELAGLPVPRTEILTPELKLDPAAWGEFVIIKPTDIGTSSKGAGIQLMRTERVRYIAPRDYPAGHPGRLGPMLVQQYINDDGHVGVYRVLTLFGEPLYAVRNRSRQPVVDLTLPDDAIENLPVAHQLLTTETREREIVDAPEEVALARAAHAATPEIPLTGVDIVRDGKTGRLYIIELNAGGNTWHFSSSFEARNRDANGAEFEHKRLTQFDALRTAARVYVRKTNADAI